MVWLREVQEKVTKSEKNQDLPELIDITAGMKVMVTQNVETNLDITNRA